ncbi:MAG: hypothetical protein ABR999_01420 [Methanoregula sp.]|jgi:hypothetical protein|uniref:hypothetical protein n=1 Tax=Methanoregula sp. TaxID=2052170 RepID=UPI003D13312E
MYTSTGSQAAGRHQCTGMLNVAVTDTTSGMEEKNSITNGRKDPFHFNLALTPRKKYTPYMVYYLKKKSGKVTGLSGETFIRFRGFSNIGGWEFFPG